MPGGPTADEELIAYICGGPLLQPCGLSEEAVRESLSDWLQQAQQLCAQLGFDAENLDAIQRLRVHRYYLPVLFWVRGQLEQHIKAGKAGPLVLGISAPQGCGKSTIVESLEALFNAQGTHAASVSIDDFYLTREGQKQLAEAYPDNRLLQVRGNAGTHDLLLGASTLQTLKKLTKVEAVALPRYDKSAYKGLGDRAPASAWPSVSGPLQLVLFEGWMLGFAPLASDAAASAVEDGLVEVNRRLAEYREAWDSHVDSWLVVKIGNPQWVFKWRKQAEDKMKAGGKPGMTDEQVADFVSRYMPAYTAYLPGLYRDGPTTATPGHLLMIEVDEGRGPVTHQPPPAACGSKGSAVRASGTVYYPIGALSEFTAKVTRRFEDILQCGSADDVPPRNATTVGTLVVVAAVAALAVTAIVVVRMRAAGGGAAA